VRLVARVTSEIVEWLVLRGQLRVLARVFVTDETEFFSASLQQTLAVGLVRIVTEEAIPLGRRRVPMVRRRDIPHVAVTGDAQLLFGGGESRRSVRQAAVACLTVRLGVGSVNEPSLLALRRSVRIVAGGTKSARHFRSSMEFRQLGNGTVAAGAKLGFGRDQ
jgi:hypothetical protein